jgi:hypothetical protein
VKGATLYHYRILSLGKIASSARTGRLGWSGRLFAVRSFQFVEAFHGDDPCANLLGQVRLLGVRANGRRCQRPQPSRFEEALRMRRSARFRGRRGGRPIGNVIRGLDPRSHLSSQNLEPGDARGASSKRDGSVGQARGQRWRWGGAAHATCRVKRRGGHAGGARIRASRWLCPPYIPAKKRIAKIFSIRYSLLRIRYFGFHHRRSAGTTRNGIIPSTTLTSANTSTRS